VKKSNRKKLYINYLRWKQESESGSMNPASALIFPPSPRLCVRMCCVCALSFAEREAMKIKITYIHSRKNICPPPINIISVVMQTRARAARLFSVLLPCTFFLVGGAGGRQSLFFSAPLRIHRPLSPSILLIGLGSTFCLLAHHQAGAHTQSTSKQSATREHSLLHSSRPQK
jgi:hypothetical protein